MAYGVMSLLLSSQAYRPRSSAFYSRCPKVQKQLERILLFPISLPPPLADEHWSSRAELGVSRREDAFACARLWCFVGLTFGCG